MKNQAPSTITFQYPGGRNETFINDEESLYIILERLTHRHGADQIRAILEANHAQDFDENEDEDEEFAMVWAPELLIDRHGRFFCMTANGREELTPQYNGRGRPFIIRNDWTYWAHVETYKAFVGDYNSQTHVVEPRDGDPKNCHVSNLMLVKRPRRFQQSDSAAECS